MNEIEYNEHGMQMESWLDQSTCKKKDVFFLDFFFFFSFVNQRHNYDTNKLNAAQRCGIMCKGLYNGRSGEWCEGCCTLLVR